MKILGLGAIVLPFLLAGLVEAGGVSAANAQAEHEYVIAANDGYGIGDCLGEGSECGQVVADAWCEAHGHGHALSFGQHGSATQVSTRDEFYVIDCGD